MGLADHVGRETEIEALGKKWRLSRWDREVWAQFVDWARPRLPDPLAIAQKALQNFPAHLHDSLIRVAMERAADYLAPGSPGVQQALSSLEGTAYLLYLLLRKNHPDVTEAIAFDIAMSVEEKDLRRAFQVASGKAPPASQGNAEAPSA